MATVPISFSGNSSFSTDPASGTVQISVPEIENTTPNGTTGSIKVVLWYTPSPYTGGTINGYQVASVPYTNVLGPNQYFDPGTFTEPFTTPPDGTYYATLALEEYDGSTYVIENYLNYNNTNTVADGRSTVPVALVGASSFTTDPADGTVQINLPEVQNTSTTGTTGSLKAVLWYTTSPYTGGTITGYQVATVPYTNVLGPNQYFSPGSFTEPYTPPPDGTYYATLALEEYDGSNYVVESYQNYSNPDVVGGGGAPHAAVHDDFNGNGTSDILWQNSAGGTVVQWLMNGVAPSAQAGIGGGGGWSIVGTGDFNGDGKSDILWQNSASGTVSEWEMNGAQQIASGAVGGGGWTIAGTGDFNGDGKSDILWRGPDGSIVEWGMNGLQATSMAFIGGSGGGWNVVGTGDFNGDGRSDILWQNSASGTVVMWEMNGSQVLGSAAIGGGGGWNVAGTGDFNGDGKSDILWQNSTSGAVVMWEMNGTQVSGTAGIGGGGGWNVVGTGDFNGDGKSDILWQNSTSGTVVMWEMNGAQVTAAAPIGGGGGWKPLAL